MNFSFLTLPNILQIVIFFSAIFIAVVPLGSYMAKVYSGERHFMSPVFGWLERLIYKLSGVSPDKEMNWKEYSFAMLVFSFIGFLFVFLIVRFQSVFGHNPENFPDISSDLAFNIAASFLTNTNWQSYSGEATLTYFSQMAALTVQNFLSAAVGIAVLMAMVRGFARKNTDGLGNFWVDMVRGNLYILLPLSLIIAVILVSQGVVQSLDAYKVTETIQPNETAVTQKLAIGPAASQVAIKQLGTNGGGFFNANSAHPYENPTPFSNFIEVLAILLIPAALCHSFGKMVGDTRQGRVILITMTIIFIPFMLLAMASEQSGNPLLSQLGVDQNISIAQSGGNMEGKEVRFGSMNSALWASASTAASSGSVNAMIGSFTPMGGLVSLTFMHFSEVIYGGVGAGLYGMLIFVILAVFIAGLMVGRTPEYLGKRIQSYEIKMASIAILTPSFFTLVGTAIALLTEEGRAGISFPGTHGFTEVLYAFTSASYNNGSAYAGLSANTPFYNTALGICMLFGRFFVIIPVLAIAGSLAAKNTVPESAGTMPTHTPLFVVILTFVIIMSLLTSMPALALGPIAEYFMLK